MNEWERLRRQAERYKEQYPSGTRVLLLHMGEDPRPVEDNVRGTVRYVDDMGTVHCAFDNGRSLGLIPGEDSFRMKRYELRQLMRHEDTPRPEANESQPVCRERPYCLNCPYPAHGFVCWGEDDCMRKNLQQIYGKETSK